MCLLEASSSESSSRGFTCERRLHWEEIQRQSGLRYVFLDLPSQYNEGLMLIGAQLISLA